MKIIQMPVGIFDANCYILFCKKTLEAAVIDPGGEGESILKQILDNNLKLKYILITHGHFDHIGAVKYLKAKTRAKVLIHGDDAPNLMDVYKNLSYSMGNECIQIKPDMMLQDGDELSIGDIKAKVLYTPGHSPGGICILIPDKAIFTGDTLFAGSIGRTDFVGGDQDLLINSIEQKLMVLDDDIIVYPGHGGVTTIGKERQNNSFI
ncbi:MAG: MBL fold metallo-hydrolase [Xylanivirga thermophila]|jgi:hydroxyacylglutathione hydrolase|uniref:MBL fold metallo-hydrolase n=1 Tax=Xylanivirga thermophila TaxID=2496273 RepID=UPI00101DA230|nr:MBL fold metallo-hydrolase [Xylanivirga thermophila]